MEQPLHRDTILSYDYITYQEEANHNFQHHDVGIREIEYNRRLSQMRQRQRGEREAALGFNEMTNLQRSVRSARKTIVASIVGNSIYGNDCPICYMNYEEGDKVEVLGCHPTHMMHAACYAVFKSTNEKNRVPHVCPNCRKPIDGTKVVRKILKSTMDEGDDPFNVKERHDNKVDNELKVPANTNKFQNLQRPRRLTPMVMPPHENT